MGLFAKILSIPLSLVGGSKKKKCDCDSCNCNGVTNTKQLYHGSRLDAGITGLEGYKEDPVRSPLDGALFDNQFIR